MNMAEIMSGYMAFFPKPQLRKRITGENGQRHGKYQLQNRYQERIEKILPDLEILKMIR